jgi:hypothetical protein
MKTLTVEKLITDRDMPKYFNTFVKPSQIKTILDEDADVYTSEGKLLLRFRKKKLSKDKSDRFYNAVADFTMKNPSKNRGSTSGSKKKDIRHNPAVMSSILGYFDRWGPGHKFFFNKLKMKHPLEVRETMFTATHPDKFKKTFPYVKEIDAEYKRLVPTQYKKQRKKANQTFFKIPGTSFTTITTNINFQTSIHTDKGDDVEGFGNLAVIERGHYTGGETCFPQYGVAVNVREGDILFMNVHEWHGNLPIVKANENVIRMSVVCYLRKNIWVRTRGKSKKFMQNHLKSVKNVKLRVRKLTQKNKRKMGGTRKNVVGGFDMLDDKPVYSYKVRYQ